MVEEVRLGIEKCVELAGERKAKSVVVCGWSAGAQLVLQVHIISYILFPIVIVLVLHCSHPSSFVPRYPLFRIFNQIFTITHFI